MSVDHVHMLFGKMVIQIFCLFLIGNLSFCLLYILDIRDLLRTQFADILANLSFILFTVFLQSNYFFHFDEI